MGCNKDDTGKEGKDDAAMRALLQMIDEDEVDNLLPRNMAESRKFIKVKFAGSGELPEEDRRLNQNYWQEATTYGLVDSTFATSEGDTVVVLSVTDEKEAEQLIENSPMATDDRVEPGEMKVLSED